MITPPKLQIGDEVRIIAPATSFSCVSAESQKIIKSRFLAYGLKLSISEHAEEKDEFESSSIQNRVADLHSAFLDPQVKAIICAKGGYNSNQLLPYLDYELIKNHPKILMGFSDITALLNAITAKTGIITYSGPTISRFGMPEYFEYTEEYWKKAVFSHDSYEIKASEYWDDDNWWEEKNRHRIKNEGYQVIQAGEAEGTIWGGNLCTFNLLQGTPYFPNLQNSILFIEDDDLAKEFSPQEFDRNLESLTQVPEFSGVKGIVFGKFQQSTTMTFDKLQKIVKEKKALKNLPILANVDFGHINDIFTFPIGGKAKFQNQSIIIT